MEGRHSRELNGKAPAPRSAMADGKVGPFLPVVANGDALAQRSAIPRGAGSSVSSVGEQQQQQQRQQQQQLAVVSATREVSSRAGEEVVLECSLLGPPDVDVDWWRSGRLVQPALLGCRMRSDGRKARLVFPAAHEEDSGFYTCRLSTAKEEQTCSIRLVVRPSLLPIFTRKPESLDVADGRPARLDCRVSGTPAPTVTWFRDGRPVQSGERRRVSSEKGLHCLSVPHASAEDEGEYTVTAANTHGEVSCSCTLIVSEPRAPHASNISKRDMMPSIAEEPELGEVERDGDIESHRDGPRDSATTLGRSARQPAPPRSGKVAARDARSAGVPRPSTPSGPLLRDPKAAPDFSQPLCDVAVLEGGCAVLECRGQARIPPQVSWLRQGEQVPLGGRVTSKEGEAAHSIAQTLTRNTLSLPPSLVILQGITGLTPLRSKNGTFRLIIQSAKLADAGVYKCILSNSAGRAFCHAHLHVVDATPGPPDGPPIVTDVTDDSVTLSWKPPKAFQAFSEPGSVTYALQYQVVGRSQWIVVASNVPGTSHAVRTLRPGLHYLFRALTVSPHGCSRPSPASAPTCLLPHEPFLNEPPRFVKKYEEIFAVENEPLEITCRLNHVQATVSWTRDGIPVDESSGEVRLSSRPGGTWALEMPRARAELLGELVCTARGEFGSDSYTAVVSQAEAPHFEVIMEDVEVQEGDPVRLSVVVHGRPEPDVLWYKDGARLAEAGGLASVTRSGSACSLLLRDVRGSDRGLYACEARSRAGTARCMAELSVHMEKSEARQREMPEEEVRKLKDHYEILEEIGRGAFGSVRRVRALSGGSPCAAKSLPRGRVRREAAERELRVAARLAHERVVCLHDAFRSRRRVIIVMELCSNEELLDRLVKKPALSEHQVKMYIKQILEGISYLHSINILHLDIEPSNILMADAGKDDIKISDFGFAQEVVPGSPQYSEFGTPEFVSPEVARHSPVYKASDIWPVGVITYVCLSGLSPFLGENDRATLLNVTRKTLNFDERTAAITSREAQDFISRVLVQDIGRRPLADDCLKHPWFKSFTTLRAVTNISTDRLKFFLSRRRLQRSLVRYKSAVVLRSIPEVLSGHVAPRVSRRTAKQLRDAAASSSFSSSSSSSSGEEDPGGSESSNGLGLDALRPDFSARSQDDSRGSSARGTLGSDTEPAVLGRLGAVVQRNGECGSKEAAIERGLQSFSERRAAQRGVIQRTNSADAAFQDGRASVTNRSTQDGAAAASQYLKPHLSKSASLELPPKSRSPGLTLLGPPSESSTESRGPLELVKDRPSTFLAESPLVAPRRSLVREVHQRSSSDPAGSTRLERGASSSEAEDIASGRKPEVFRSSGSIPVGREPALRRQLAFEQRGQSSATSTALDTMLRIQQGGSALDEDSRKTTVVATENERCLRQQKAEPTIMQRSQSSVAQNGRGRQLQAAAATRLPQFTEKTPEPGGLVVLKPQATEARTSQAADNGTPWVTRTTGGGEAETTNTNPLLNGSKPQTVGRYARLLNAASTDGSVREMAKRFSNNGSTTRLQLAPRDEGLGQRPVNVRGGSLSTPKQTVSQTKAELLVAEAPVTQVLYRQLQQSSPEGSMLSNAVSRKGDRSISDTAMASKEQLTREPAEEPGSLVKRLSQRFKRSPSTERKSTEGTESRESEGRSKTPTMMQKFSSRLKRIGSTEKIESEHKLGEAPATEGQQAARDRDGVRDVAAEGGDGPLGRASSPAMALRRRIEATVSGLSLRSGRSRSEDRAGGGDAQAARRRAFGETRAGSLDAATDDADEQTGLGRAASEWAPLRRTGSEGASLRELSGDEGGRALSRGVKPPPSPSSSSMRSVTSASTDTEEPERRSRWDRWGASRLNRRDRSPSPHQDSGSSSRDSLASVSRENPAPAARLSGFKESVRRSLRSSESLPAFTVKLKDELLVEGEPVTLCCSPTGSPAPTISWLKDRKLLEPDERVRLAGSADGRQLLTIVRAGMADAGVYECMAVNSLGIATTSCTLARAGTSLVNHHLLHARSCYSRRGSSDFTTGPGCYLQMPTMYCETSFKLHIANGCVCGPFNVLSLYTEVFSNAVHFTSARVDTSNSRFDTACGCSSIPCILPCLCPPLPTCVSLSLPVSPSPCPCLPSCFCLPLPLGVSEPPSWTGAAPEVPQVFESGALVVWKPVQARTPLTYCLEMQAGPGEPWKEVASGLSDTYHHVGGLCQGLAYRFRVACATRAGKGRGSPASEPALIPGGRALGVTARSRRDIAGPPATVATAQGHAQGHPQAPYTFLEEKARGRFGVIRVCRENATGRAFAAKVLAAADEESRALARAEFDALRSLSHEHVLAVHEAFVTPRHVVLVTELVGGSELLQHLCERRVRTCAGGRSSVAWVCQNQNIYLRRRNPMSCKALFHRRPAGGRSLHVVNRGGFAAVPGGALRWWGGGG
uniref:Striated muscle-specific serine/threonine-protein kinase-like n=1 Tax=Petromyzon marinus TaxID=7757 RepID=A0AAJ7SNB8_PETMA|nr:striated muscle-specific serine/threonine-protein kinase-like [Petromyzon marinus]